MPEAVLELLKKLNDSGYDAYIVGGCVRDLVMDIKPHDYDITTSATPEEVHEVLRDYYIIDTGIKHGTVTVMYDGEPYEITTFRADSPTYSDHRHPDTVTYSKTVEEDLIRRDFTVNAMAYSPATGLVDLHGGLEDISNKIIRCVGNPDTRFNEDALRILRCIRFAGKLHFTIEQATEEALFRQAPLLDYISSERIMSEFSQILLCDDIENILMKYRDIFTQFIPELKDLFDYDQHSRYHLYDLWTHTCMVTAGVRPYLPLRFAALLHDIGKPECKTVSEDGYWHYHGHNMASADKARIILKRLTAPNNLIQEVIPLIENHDRRLFTDKSIRKTYNIMGSRESMDNLVELMKADNDTKNLETLSFYNDEYYEHIKVVLDAEDTQLLTVHDLAINGDDLTSRGLTGKDIGKALQKALNGVLEGLVDNDKQELLKFLNLSD